MSRGKGGRPKGRPKKVELVMASNVSCPPTSPSEAECSNAADRRKTVGGNGEQEDRGDRRKQIEEEIHAYVLKQQLEVQKEGLKEAEVKKVEEGEIPPMRNRGVALGYVAPCLKEGIPTAKLNVMESTDSLSRIGSVIGTFICADECTSKQQRISYARMLVEVDITKPLIYKVNIEGEEGMKIEQQVYYEWVPFYCQKCQQVGHICKEKNEEIGRPRKQQQWRPKEMGKGVEGKEEWQQPKKVAASAIQVDEGGIGTSNAYQKLGGTNDGEGGDRIPSGGS